MKTALLVIDVQESFRVRPYYSETGKAAYFAAQNALIEGAAARGMPIVQVLHHDGPNEASHAFALASGLVRPMAELAAYTPAHQVLKRRHSALVGTDLRQWLTEAGIGRLMVSGIRTEQCCETTTRNASDEGFEVLYVPKATWTWDLATPHGTLTAAVLVERTCTVLHERFARICSVSEALAHA